MIEPETFLPRNICCLWYSQSQFPYRSTAPVSAGVSEDVVKQLKDELDLLKKEVESLRFLAKEIDLLKSEYKKDIETLTQNLGEECTKVAGLQAEIEQLKKIKQ